MKKITKKIDTNLIIAFGVLLASVGALIVSTRQASIMNRQTQIFLEQSKSSAWPSISLNMSKNLRNGVIKSYNISISNRGTGPAIVEQTIVSYDGNPISNWGELYKSIQTPDSIELGHFNNILLKRVIKSSEDILLIDWSENKELMEFIYHNADKISIEICYKSVYGDHWKIRRDGFKNNLEQNMTTQIEYCEESNGVKFQE